MPDGIVHSDQAEINPAEMAGKMEDETVTNTTAAVQYKETDSQDDQMDRHK